MKNWLFHDIYISLIVSVQTSKSLLNYIAMERKKTLWRATLYTCMLK